MKKYLAIILIVFVVLVSCGEDESTTPSGDNYETVTIGTQTWMLKNLDVFRYRNGDSIPQVTDPDEWANLTTGAWCYYDNDTANGEIYGKLYNWYAVNDPRGLAPDGWHVPTDEEWKELEMCLGMSQSEADNWSFRGTNEGSKLAGNHDLWHTGDLQNSTEFGTSNFTALPGGFRYNNDIFIRIGYIGCWWSSTEYSFSSAVNHYLSNSDSTVIRSFNNKGFGHSVRCVRD